MVRSTVGAARRRRRRRIRRSVERRRSPRGAVSSRRWPPGGRASSSSRICTGRDGALLEFLEHLLDWSTPVPLLLLCTARPELFERSANWGGGKRNATTISLAPLSDRGVRAACCRCFSTARCFRRRRRRCFSNGRAGTRSTRSSSRACSWSAEMSRASPSRRRCRRSMAARLDTLAPELKALLHDASVAGRVFWSGAVAAVSGRERDDVRRDLNELVRREFVRPSVSPRSGARTSSPSGTRSSATSPTSRFPAAPRGEKHVAAAAWVEQIAGGAGRRPRRDPRLPLRPGARALARRPANDGQTSNRASSASCCSPEIVRRSSTRGGRGVLSARARARGRRADRAMALARLAPVLGEPGGRGRGSRGWEGGGRRRCAGSTTEPRRCCMQRPSREQLGPRRDGAGARSSRTRRSRSSSSNRRPSSWLCTAALPPPGNRRPVRRCRGTASTKALRSPPISGWTTSPHS